MTASDLRWPIALLCGSVLLPIAVEIVRRRHFHWLGPRPVFAASMLLGFILPIQPYLDGLDPLSIIFPVSVNVAASVGTALWLAGAGAIAFGLGLSVAPRFVRRSRGSTAPRVRWSRRRFRVAAVVLTVLGTGFFAAGVALIGGVQALFTAQGDRIRAFEGKNYLFQAVNLLLSVALVWFAELLREPGPLRRRVFFWVYLAITFGFVGMLGNKSTLFVATVALAAMYDEGRRRIGAVVALLGGVLLVLGLVGYALYAREYLVSGAFQTITTLDAASIWRVVQTQLSSNFIQLQTLTLLVDRMPQALGWQYGGTFLSLLTMPIPRGLWPGKLLPAPGPFTHAFYPDLWINSGTTIPPGLLGECYMNFGSAGVLLGLFVTGVVYGLLRAKWRRLRDSRSLIAYGLMIGLLPHYIRGEAVSPTVQFLLIFLPAIWLLHFVERRVALFAQPLQVPMGAEP